MTSIEAALIASAVHAQWAKWQKYQNNCNKKTLGLSPWNEHFVSFSQEDWERWNRLATLPFDQLTGKEQRSDIEVAKEIWEPVFRQILETKQRELDRAKTAYRVKLAERDALFAKVQALRKYLKIEPSDEKKLDKDFIMAINSVNAKMDELFGEEVKL